MGRSREHLFVTLVVMAALALTVVFLASGILSVLDAIGRSLSA